MPNFSLIRLRAPPSVKVVSPDSTETVDTVAVQIVAEAKDEGGGIQGPWLKHNGARVLAGGKSQRDGNTVRQVFDVQLVEGENNFEVYAANADGSWESEPATITFNYEKTLAKPALHVVAVGVSDYSRDNFKLQYAHADAKKISELFQRRAPALYSDVHVKLLTNEQATKSAIIKALKEAAEVARPQDTLVLFLAGHGTMVGQRYYFIPHEFQTNAETNLDEDVRRQGLPADVLGDFLMDGKALKRIMILDTCSSGGTVDLFQIASRDPFAFRGAIERLGRNNGIFMIAASAATQAAKESNELGHGVLSYALLAGLRDVSDGPLVDKSVVPGQGRVAGVLEWFSFASGQVPMLTKKYFHEEQNVHFTNKGSSFPLLPVDDN